MKKGYKKREHRGIIYKVSCNNHFLFGSTVNFSNRKYQYLKSLKTNNYNNPILQACYNKYGEESIKFEIIQENIPEEILLFLEDIYIGANNSLLEDNPNNGMNFKTASRPILTQETRNKISKAGKGRKLSEETKAKMKGRIPWNKGLITSEKTKEKLSQKLKDHFKNNNNKIRLFNNNPKAIKIIHIKTGEIFDTIKKASIKFNINYITLVRNLKNNKQEDFKYFIN